MTQELFRKRALDKVSSPEQLDQLIQITSPRSWLALLTLVSLLVLALIWAWFGRIPLGVSGQGVLLGKGGVHTVVATVQGQLVSLEADMGDTVPAGGVVAYVRPLDAAAPLHPVRSPYAGLVMETVVAPGDLVSLGSPLLTVASEPESLEAVLYVPVIDGQLIRPGMEVNISPEGLRKEQAGFLKGTVRSVGRYPVSSLRVRRTVGSGETAQRLLGEEPVLEVRVELTPDPATPSGYRWSLPRGPQVSLAPGTTIRGTVIAAQQRPLSLLLPAWGP